MSEQSDHETPRELAGLEVDPALFRGLTGRRTSRRGFMQAGAGAAGALGLSSILAACGVAGTKANSKNLDLRQRPTISATGDVSLGT